MILFSIKYCNAFSMYGWMIMLSKNPLQNQDLNRVWNLLLNPIRNPVMKQSSLRRSAGVFYISGDHLLDWFTLFGNTMDSTTEVTQQRHGARFLLASMVCTGVLYLMPFGSTIAYPLVLMSTLAHEMGHGLAALLVGGTFHEFQIFSDSSGVAYTSSKGAFASAFIAAGGLVGPAIVSMIFLLGLIMPSDCFFLGIGLVIAEVWVVRNLFGLAFVGSIAIASLWVSSLKNHGIQRLMAYFIGIQLALSVFSRSDYLFTPVANTGRGTMPSDVANMASTLWLPYWVWGGSVPYFPFFV